MNYAELYQLVIDMTENENSTFTGNIPTMVKLAEERIGREVQLPDFRKSQEGTLTSGNRFLTLPSDWLSTYSLSVEVSSSYQLLITKDVNFINEAFPSTSATGVPRFYATWDDDTLVLGPAPDSNYTVELYYYFLPESIVTASTTWLGTNAQNALLYGTLIQAANYMQIDQDIMANYQQEYNQALASLIMLAEGRLRKDDYRMSRPRVETS